MGFWLSIAVSLVVSGVLLYRRGPLHRSRRDIRRCPHCRYDLSATTSPPCPECGFAWSSDDQFRSLPRARLQRISGVMLLAMAVAVVVMLPVLTGRSWTYFVPRAGTSLALDVLVADQPARLGSHLPATDAGLRLSNDRWDRLVWQRQASRAIEHFLDLVEQSSGSLDDKERLVPAAVEAHDILQQQAGTYAEDGWIMQSVLDRARARRAALDSRSALPIGTWAAAELQYYAGDSDLARGWIEPPLEVLEALSRSHDTSIRGYVVDRIALIRGTEASAILDRLAGDPDPSVQAKASAALKWRRGIRGWR